MGMCLVRDPGSGRLKPTDGHRGTRIAIDTFVAILLGIATSGLSPPASGSTKRVSIEMLGTQSVVAGKTARFPFLLNVGSRPVTFLVSGLVDGVHAEISPGGNDRYELLLHTAVNSPGGHFTVSIRARYGSAVISKLVYLEIAR